MRKVAIADLPATEAVSFSYSSGPEAEFAFPLPEDAEEGATARKIMVRTDGTTLRFFPERSGGHRDVLKALGLNE